MKELDTVQVEQLRKIGESLSKTREEQAIPLEEVAVKTYIPLRLLQALEKAQVERLPEPVFIQGFIRRYADALGLDGTALSKTFSIESAAVATKPPEAEPPSFPSAPNNPLPELPRRVLDQVPSLPPYLPIALLGGLALLVLGFGAMSLFNKPKSNSNQSNSAISSRQAVTSPATNSNQAAKPATSPQPVASAQPSPEAAKPKFAAPPSLAEAPVQAVVELSGESWMQITVDGKQEFEGTAKKGYKKTWAAKKSLVIQAGNAGAVSVAYNQGEAKTLGAQGEVKEIALPPEAAPTGQASQ